MCINEDVDEMKTSSLTDTEALNIIDKYCLSVRKLPEKIISTYEMRHHVEGNEIVELHGRKMTRQTKIPVHAGWYMTTQTRDTGRIVMWDIKKDCLAPTLKESLSLFLEKINQENIQ
jgi:hypothetical protein